MSPETRVWLLASGKIGHEVNCRGVLSELGLTPVVKTLNPRPFYQKLSPYGPVDPQELKNGADSPFAGPFPDIVIASGRVTVPYLRHIKKASQGRVFTAFMQDPRWGRGACDMIWVPEHDTLRGPNVLATLTSPHPLRPSTLAAARANPDPRIAGLPKPRLAMILGGPSGAHTFEAADVSNLVGIAVQAALAGYSVMATPSRRTPPECTQAIAHFLSALPEAEHHFVWDGMGDNPYVAMLANAQALLVTSDSANMLGEAVSTGLPVHVYEPTGGNAKMSRFLERLVAVGAVRRWAGKVETWAYAPIDATAEIAATLAKAYAAHRIKIGA